MNSYRAFRASCILVAVCVMLSGCAGAVQFPKVSLSVQPAGAAEAPARGVAPEGGDAAQPASGSPSLSGRTWVLVSYGAPRQQAALPDGAKITLKLAQPAMKASGRAACNPYFAEYSADGDRLAVRNVGATRMACSDDLMKLEAVYLKALARAETYSISDTNLDVAYDGGKGLLKFEARK